MAKHLVESGDHGRLGFRSDCPVCRRERLSGPLPATPLVPHRTRAGAAAALAAALLVTGNGGLSQPGGALAQADPGEISDQDLDGLANEIDGASGSNPNDTTAPPEEQGTDDTPTSGPDDEPAGEEPVIPGADDPTGDAQGDAPPPPAQVAPPAAQVAPPAAQVAPPAAQVAPPAAQVAPPPAQVSPSPSPAPPSKAKEGPAPVAPNGGDGKRSATPSQDSLPPTPVPRQSAQAQQAPPSPVAPTAAGAPAATPTCAADDAQTRVVQPGDSLWAIASERLGRNASAAALAREVARLWELNADRIASGKPDLLIPGECLVLSG